MSTNDRLMDVITQFAKLDSNLAGKGVAKIILKDGRTAFGQNLVATKFSFYQQVLDQNQMKLLNPMGRN